MEKHGAISPGQEKICSEIASAVRAIKFGQIVLTVHNGRIVQIDKTEKIRVNESSFEYGAGI